MLFDEALADLSRAIGPEPEDIAAELRKLRWAIAMYNSLATYSNTRVPPGNGLLDGALRDQADPVKSRISSALAAIGNMTAALDGPQASGARWSQPR